MRPSALALLALLPLAACDCEGSGITQITDSGVMMRCRGDMDCGPREACNVSLGICFSRDACGPDTPCPNDNQVCEDQDGDGFLDCGFRRCTDAAECSMLECPPDQVPACIAGGCSCGTPCQGGCPGSQGCCILDDTCLDLPEECMGLTCAPGQFVSVTSSGAWDARQCQFLGEACRCETLPPLPLGDIGLYSALAHDGRTPILSAYNLDYGDLMFGVVELGGDTVTWEFVDGVPTSTQTITGDIAGPRNGQGGPGRDVGIYTDLAADPQGRPHIAYVDRDEQDLRYAVGTPSGWRLHTVATDGDTGLYASLALTPSGRARIAFLGAREDDGSGLRKTVLRLAVTSSGTPSAPTDWTIRELETLSLLPYGCSEQCRVGEVCRAADLRCVRPDDPPRCAPACAGDERCVAGRCALIDPLPAFRDVPLARGLWPSLAVLPDGGLLVAYYDRLSLSLTLAHVAGPDPAVGAVTRRTLEGDGVDNTDDTGLYPSLFVTPGGEIHLAYVNATRRRLMYKNLDANLNAVSTEIVEDGLDPMFGPEGHYIGADPALAVDTLGQVRVAYQDGTTGELRYARRQPGGGWVRATLRGAEAPYEGTFGFYTDQIVRPEPLISTYRYFLAGPNMMPANGVVVVTPP